MISFGISFKVATVIQKCKTYAQECTCTRVCHGMCMMYSELIEITWPSYNSVEIFCNKIILILTAELRKYIYIRCLSRITANMDMMQLRNVCIFTIYIYRLVIMSNFLFAIKIYYVNRIKVVTCEFAVNLFSVVQRFSAAL